MHSSRDGAALLVPGQHALRSPKWTEHTLAGERQAADRLDERRLATARRRRRHADQPQPQRRGRLGAAGEHVCGERGAYRVGDERADRARPQRVTPTPVKKTTCRSDPRRGSRSRLDFRVASTPNRRGRAPDDRRASREQVAMVSVSADSGTQSVGPERWRGAPRVGTVSEMALHGAHGLPETNSPARSGRRIVASGAGVALRAPSPGQHRNGTADTCRCRRSRGDGPLACGRSLGGEHSPDRGRHTDARDRDVNVRPYPNECARRAEVT